VFTLKNATPCWLWSSLGSFDETVVPLAPHSTAVHGAPKQLDAVRASDIGVYVGLAGARNTRGAGGAGGGGAGESIDGGAVGVVDVGGIVHESATKPAAIRNKLLVLRYPPTPPTSAAPPAAAVPVADHACVVTAYRAATGSVALTIQCWARLQSCMYVTARLWTDGFIRGSHICMRQSY
jgi:hypothetical protein